MYDLSRILHNDTAVLRADIAALAERLDKQSEVLAIPPRDIPTVEELLVQAKADPTIRAAFEATLAELEFNDPTIEYN